MKKLYKLIESGNFDYSKVTNKEEYFEEHIPKLKELGFVSEKFADAIAKRESIYPTGLQTKIYGIALPHVESEYVKKSGIMITKFENPIIFKRMDDFNEEVQVKVAFMLLIDDSESHMEALKELVSFCQDEAFLTELLTIDTKDQLFKLVERRSQYV